MRGRINARKRSRLRHHQMHLCAEACRQVACSPSHADAPPLELRNIGTLVVKPSAKLVLVPSSKGNRKSVTPACLPSCNVQYAMQRATICLGAGLPNFAGAAAYVAKPPRVSTAAAGAAYLVRFAPAAAHECDRGVNRRWPRRAILKAADRA